MTDQGHESLAADGIVASDHRIECELVIPAAYEIAVPYRQEGGIGAALRAFMMHTSPIFALRRNESSGYCQRAHDGARLAPKTGRRACDSANQGCPAEPTPSLSRWHLAGPTRLRAPAST